MSESPIQASPVPPLSTVPYVRLGTSGLKVSKLILGCMTYGSSKWAPWVLDEAEGVDHIKAAYDLGINTFDTADVYSNGYSEIVLGKTIKKYNLPRDEIVVMTKIYATVLRNPGDLEFGISEQEMERMRYTNQKGLNRKHIFEAVNRSLERLQLDYIDVLQCHRFDYNTPIEETMQALHDVVKAGLARYIGMSSCWAWQFQKMQSYARQHNLTEFISMQNRYNATYREEEREMIPMLKDLGVGMIPYTVLASGFLTRRIGGPQTGRSSVDNFAKFLNGDPEQDRFLAEINERQAIAQIAEKRGVSMGQIAIAWLLSKPFVTAPIVGSTSIDKLKDLIAGIEVKLSEEEVKSIDEPYLPRAVAGHN